jgi:hypothetical protein
MLAMSAVVLGVGSILLEDGELRALFFWGCCTAYASRQSARLGLGRPSSRRAPSIGGPQVDVTLAFVDIVDTLAVT